MYNAAVIFLIVSNNSYHVTQSVAIAVVGVVGDGGDVVRLSCQQMTHLLFLQL